MNFTRNDGDQGAESKPRSSAPRLALDTRPGKSQTIYSLRREEGPNPCSRSSDPTTSPRSTWRRAVARRCGLSTRASAPLRSICTSTGCPPAAREIRQHLYRPPRRGHPDDRGRNPPHPHRRRRLHPGRHAAFAEQPLRRAARAVRDLRPVRRALRFCRRRGIAHRPQVRIVWSKPLILRSEPAEFGSGGGLKRSRTPFGRQEARWRRTVRRPQRRHSTFSTAPEAPKLMVASTTRKSWNPRKQSRRRNRSIMLQLRADSRTSNDAT